VTATLIGYARCSTGERNLAAQRAAPPAFGMAEDRIYLDRGLTGTARAWPGPDQARTGDAFVVPKLDRLARSVHDAARAIGDSLVARKVRLQLSAIVYDSANPLGKMFFNILATPAELKVPLLRLHTRERMAIALAKGKLNDRAPKLSPPRRPHLVKVHTAGERSLADLAELFEVSRATVYRVLDRANAATAR
jgi:DNA invertase Pin-like site-specific DNA recombinase